jgi:CHAT domain-containing protein
MLFDQYRDAPWLIRKVSTARIPSASAFVMLRSIPPVEVDRRPFIGFGDPIFHSDQMHPASAVAGVTPPVNHRGVIHLRGIRLTDTGQLDSEKILSSQLEHLQRLPDTADEIISIADALGADKQKDIFLGRQATEHQVKSMDLSGTKVIAFATHALVPGDLDGLNQPALAFCSPAVVDDANDGLLTAGEILMLNLNADWVVLSACNTGAADGAGAEALSGLGRAFFYAGTRALLVSMWPVETTAARELTSRLFSYQQSAGRRSRAQALRRSALELMDGPGFKDDASGRIVACYAHPIFWAPFIIVGDSGSN